MLAALRPRALDRATLSYALHADAMTRDFGRIMANHRALRAGIVARLKAKSKPGKVIQFGRRRERDGNR